MKSFLIQLVFFITFCSLLQSAHAGFGPCPDSPNAYDDFSASKFRGLWYLYSTSNGYYDSYKDECRTDLVMSRGNETVGLDFKVLTSTQDANNSSRTERWVRKYDFQSEHDPHATFVSEGGFWPQHVTVVKTDHFSYAILEVCRSIGLYHWSHYEILSRDKLPSKYHRNQIAKETKKFGYHHKTDFKRAETLKCYTPEESGE
ncbi:unnamed protein product [Moneuplotes crassus]|uniref:Uncharacterized protein n=1 Tax=Euplotes crassus TaxID=5936 RepID=A0AAD1XY44_EUPCR|nr:unnamed protein product [Moneuplotes crassus]